MKKWFYILLILTIFLGCSKDQNDTIPLVKVDVIIHTNDPAYNVVAVPGGWIYINGGSRGIIIYRVSNDEFNAYDRHCTYDTSNSCGLVSIEVNNITGKDDCCSSKFSIYDGSVTQGPAGLPLKQYNTSFDGQVLRIFN